jgi:hypothetical protein
MVEWMEPSSLVEGTIPKSRGSFIVMELGVTTELE